MPGTAWARQELAPSLARRLSQVRVDFLEEVASGVLLEIFVFCLSLRVLYCLHPNPTSCLPKPIA